MGSTYLILQSSRRYGSIWDKWPDSLEPDTTDVFKNDGRYHLLKTGSASAEIRHKAIVNGLVPC